MKTSSIPLEDLLDFDFFATVDRAVEGKVAEIVVVEDEVVEVRVAKCKVVAKEPEII